MDVLPSDNKQNEIENEHSNVILDTGYLCEPYPPRRRLVIFL